GLPGHALLLLLQSSGDTNIRQQSAALLVGSRLAVPGADRRLGGVVVLEVLRHEPGLFRAEALGRLPGRLLAVHCLSARITACSPRTCASQAAAAATIRPALAALSSAAASDWPGPVAAADTSAVAAHACQRTCNRSVPARRSAMT